MDMDEIGRFLRAQEKRQKRYEREEQAQRTTVRPCGCECCHGGFCGGCGHAGCGRR